MAARESLIGLANRRRNIAIGASLGFMTVSVAIIMTMPTRPHKHSLKGSRTHTFKHAVIDDGINAMNCMSGPWNECQGKIRNRP
jgi:hypothetical protein